MKINKNSWHYRMLCLSRTYDREGVVCQPTIGTYLFDVIWHLALWIAAPIVIAIATYILYSQTGVVSDGTAIGRFRVNEARIYMFWCVVWIFLPSLTLFFLSREFHPKIRALTRVRAMLNKQVQIQ